MLDFCAGIAKSFRADRGEDEADGVYSAAIGKLGGGEAVNGRQGAEGNGSLDDAELVPKEKEERVRKGSLL